MATAIVNMDMTMMVVIMTETAMTILMTTGSGDNDGGGCDSDSEDDVDDDCKNIMPVMARHQQKVTMEGFFSSVSRDCSWRTDRLKSGNAQTNWGRPGLPQLGEARFSSTGGGQVHLNSATVLWSPWQTGGGQAHLNSATVLRSPWQTGGGQAHLNSATVLRSQWQTGGGQAHLKWGRPGLPQLGEARFTSTLPQSYDPHDKLGEARLTSTGGGQAHLNSVTVLRLPWQTGGCQAHLNWGRPGSPQLCDSLTIPMTKYADVLKTWPLTKRLQFRDWS